MGEARSSPANRVARDGAGGDESAGGTTAVFELILFRPEIPPNTGNIIRLCANTGVGLNLVHPLGFSLDDAKLRRAGLDYHEWAAVRQHVSLGDCLAALGEPRVFALSARGQLAHTSPAYRAGDAFLLGPESQGLPRDVLEGFPPDRRLRIPMVTATRSLNLSNAAAVIIYEAWRQLGFAGALSHSPGAGPGP
jgi:tRNA (cytidine/uridine-2'-O-)-methyltransferase